MVDYDPKDLRMSFCTEEGVRVKIYDTYCKNFTQKDKEAFDAKINDIVCRAELRRQLEKRRGAGNGT